jgi:ubiquinone/menaquinone biosynthesis C-methylase UbiE
MPGESGRVDYDRIAPTYDRRFGEGDDRSGTTEALRNLVHDLAASRGSAPRVLEVGCGTGKWLADLNASSPSVETSGAAMLHTDPLRVFGLDLSMGMLRQACHRAAAGGTLPFSPARGRAERLPFPTATLDLVYCVNAIHHFDRPRDFIGEACRLLRPGGRLAVIGMDPHGHRETWYVYRYFEGVYETDLRRFPSWAEIADWMSAEGLAVECRIVDRIWAPKAGRAVLGDPFIRQESCSQLALLSREAYRDGLRRIEAALDRAEAAGETLIFPVDTPLAMISGWLP